MVFWVAAASVAAIVAAGAGVASAFIYWKTFKSVNAQTEISRGHANLAGKQFEMAQRQFEEASKRFEEAFTPWMTLQFSKYRPATWATGVNGSITAIITNSGAKSFRILKLIVTHDGSQIPLKDRGELLVPPGSSRTVVNSFFVSPGVEWSTLHTTTVIEAANGKKFRHSSEWTLRHNENEEHRQEDESIEAIED
jgi:hypothetical protein